MGICWECRGTSWLITPGSHACKSCNPCAHETATEEAHRAYRVPAPQGESRCHCAECLDWLTHTGRPAPALAPIGWQAAEVARYGRNGYQAMVGGGFAVRIAQKRVSGDWPLTPGYRASFYVIHLAMIGGVNAVAAGHRARAVMVEGEPKQVSATQGGLF